VNAVAVDDKLRPRVLLFIGLNAVTNKHAGAGNGVVAVYYSCGLVAVMREFRGFDGFNQPRVFLFCRGAPGNMLQHSHFSRQLRAVPVFVAKLIFIQHQFAFVVNTHRWDALVLFEVMCRGHQRQQQTAQRQHSAQGHR